MIIKYLQEQWMPTEVGSFLLINILALHSSGIFSTLKTKIRVIKASLFHWNFANDAGMIMISAIFE